MHPSTWLAWLVTSLILLIWVRNPFYLVLMGLSFALVLTSLQRCKENTALFFSPLRLAVFAIPLAAALNALWTRAGDTVLFYLPAWLPLIGGKVTLEALAFGALNGLTLINLLIAFSAFNLALSIHDLVRFIPRAFYALALVISIAITYVPFTLRQAKDIRDAQAIRGNTLRGVRGWLPLFMPLLAGGLERALQLAEAMTARGFSREHVATQPRNPIATLLGLVLVCAGWLLHMLWRVQTAGLLVLMSGVSLMAFALWRLGAQHKHTHYRVQRFGAADACIAASLLVVLGVCFVRRDQLFYYPYPLLSLPTFAPELGATLLLLAAPALTKSVRHD